MENYDVCIFTSFNSATKCALFKERFISGKLQ